MVNFMSCGFFTIVKKENLQEAGLSLISSVLVIFAV